MDTYGLEFTFRDTEGNKLTADEAAFKSRSMLLQADNKRLLWKAMVTAMAYHTAVRMRWEPTDASRTLVLDMFNNMLTATVPDMHDPLYKWTESVIDYMENLFPPAPDPGIQLGPDSDYNDGQRRVRR